MDDTTEGVTARRFTPREVRISALPEAEVEALLPCLPKVRVRVWCLGGGGIFFGGGEKTYS